MASWIMWTWHSAEGSPGRSRAAIAGSVLVAVVHTGGRLTSRSRRSGNGPGGSSAQIPQVRRDSDRRSARASDHVDVGVTKAVAFGGAAYVSPHCCGTATWDRRGVRHVARRRVGGHHRPAAQGGSGGLLRACWKLCVDPTNPFNREVIARAAITRRWRAHGQPTGVTLGPVKLRRARRSVSAPRQAT